MTLAYTSFILTVLALLLTGCSNESAPPATPQLPTVTMQIGTRTFTLEVAATHDDRQKGLMDRQEMPIDRGMIFVFADEAMRSFWMKRTRIPLDILYVDSGGKVVDIKSMQPLDLRSTPGKAPARYAIEINRGAAALAGVKEGDVLVIPSEARQPRD
jgi:uncharacterized membrane protein (UPF0127 family)